MAAIGDIRATKSAALSSWPWPLRCICRGGSCRYALPLARLILLPRRASGSVFCRSRWATGRASRFVRRECRTDKGGRPLQRAKSGRSRNVILPAFVVAELRTWRARQAEALLRLASGRPGKPSFAHARMGSHCNPTASRTHGISSLAPRHCRASASMTCGTRTQHTCWPLASIPRSPVSG